MFSLQLLWNLHKTGHSYVFFPLCLQRVLELLISNFFWKDDQLTNLESWVWHGVHMTRRYKAITGFRHTTCSLSKGWLFGQQTDWYTGSLTSSMLWAQMHKATCSDGQYNRRIITHNVAQVKGGGIRNFLKIFPANSWYGYQTRRT